MEFFVLLKRKKMQSYFTITQMLSILNSGMSMRKFIECTKILCGSEERE
jgi:hypothetical protein